MDSVGKEPNACPPPGLGEAHVACLCKDSCTGSPRNPTPKTPKLFWGFRGVVLWGFSGVPGVAQGYRGVHHGPLRLPEAAPGGPQGAPRDLLRAAFIISPATPRLIRNPAIRRTTQSTANPESGPIRNPATRFSDFSILLVFYWFFDFF